MKTITSSGGTNSPAMHDFDSYKYRWLNGTEEEECTFKAWSHSADQPGFFRIFTIISVLTVLVVLVVLGNALVIAAVILRRRLRSATGLLILSLAVADLLVGLVILPFSIANEVLNSYWIFGDTWCTMWLTMDIWMCTASIYNLVAISLDRYIAIIKPLNYPMIITKFRARLIVLFVWVFSFIICSPSFILGSLGGQEDDDKNYKEPHEKCACTPANSGTAYIIISASSSFYIPMTIVIFVYVRIYMAACAATKSVYSGMMEVTAHANKNPKSTLMQNPAALSRVENMPMLRVHRGSSANAFKGIPSDSARSRVSASNPGINSDGSVYDRMLIGKNRRDSQEDRKSMEETSLSTNDRKRESQDSPREKDNQMDPIDEQHEPDQNEHDKKTENNGLLENNQPNGHDKEKNGSCIKFNNNVENHNIPSNKNLLHPDSAKPKKSSGVNVLSRLIRRGPRKKAGSSYEKRLSLEIKAAKTVAIVTGCFIFCWLGFSILYGFSIKTHPVVWSIFFWLGYLNSALNPVIYTVFNREFRTCFKRLLTCNNWIFKTQPSSHTMYNSYNSRIRTTRPGYSSASAQPMLTSRASPPISS